MKPTKAQQVAAACTSGDFLEAARLACTFGAEAVNGERASFWASEAIKAADAAGVTLPPVTGTDWPDFETMLARVTTAPLPPPSLT